RVVSSVDKRGRSGPLTFVTVEHQFWQEGRLVVDERQDIVYREAADLAPGPTTESSPGEDAVAVGPHEWEVEISPTLLFRFSALTYNGHRIHYDRDYAVGVEGYAGLVTHGPLQAICMAEAARRAGMDTTEAVALDYRLVAPLVDRQGLVARIEEDDDRAGTLLAIRDLAGRVTARGRLTAPSSDS
ncbi:MAG: hypothetical protein QM655_15410, partial [Nocardioidaceae bacterium]